MTEHEHEFEIGVRPAYIEGQSDPSAGRYVFAYTITITNLGEVAARLLNRHWVITHGNGRTQEVRGRGVVGEQPRIAPGESFRYTSGAVLDSEVGTMVGSYEFEDDSGKLFEVPIPAFTLAAPNALH
jgi:ApaG protein